MNIYYSNAKINLFLDVLSKLKNGYHNIKSIFVEISLFDLIEYEENKLNILRFFDKNKILPEDNLFTKTGDIFMSIIKNIPFGIDFYIDKKIPIGGGLGGGSSNAASVLIILNSSWCIGFNNSKLKKIGKMIGADVPFFIDGGIQKVYGIGDKLNFLDYNKIDLNILLLFPNIGISTPYAYQLIDKKNLSFDSNINKEKFNNLIYALKNNNYSEIIKNIYNKFEPVIFEEYPLIKNVYEDMLNCNCDRAFMTGSGSTMVGIYPSEKSLNDGILKLKYLGHKVCKTNIKLK